MPSRPFNLALAQMRVEPSKFSENLTRAAERIAEVSRAGAEVVLLPEALDFGWTDPSAREGAGPIPGGGSFEFLARAARGHKVHVCAGIIEKAGGLLFNSAVLIGPDGRLLLHHRKINELGIARGLYARGNRLQVAETPFGRAGLMICADAFIEGEVISRSLAAMGAEVILSPCAWAVPADHDNGREPYGQLWLDCYGAAARGRDLWIAGASNVGPIHNGPWAGRRCIGCSMVMGPDAELVLRGPYGEEADAILYTRIGALATRAAAG